jgi:hypothetical protein
MYFVNLLVGKGNDVQFPLGVDKACVLTEEG